MPALNLVTVAVTLAACGRAKPGPPPQPPVRWWRVPVSRDFLADDEEVLVDLRPHWVFLFGPAVVTVVALAVAITVSTEFPKAPAAVTWVLAIMVVVPAAWLGLRLVQWLGTSLILTDNRLVLRRGVLGRDMVQLRLRRITEVHSVQSLLERLIGTGRLVVQVAGEEGMVAIDDVRNPRALQRVINGLLDDIDDAGRAGADEPVAGMAPRPTASAPGWSGPATAGPGSAPGWSGPATAGPGSAPGWGAPAGAGSVSPSGWVGPSTGPPTPPHGVPVARPRPGDPSIHEQLIQLDDLRRRGILTDAEFEAKKADLLSRI
jgi:hypothetical protein